ncbi:Belongs to the GRAS [Dionaea muscipula]
MQTSQESQSSSKVHQLFLPPAPPAAEISPYWSSKQVLGNIISSSPDNTTSQGTKMAVQAQAYTETKFFTLESFPATSGSVMYDSPSAISSATTGSTFSSQGSRSYISDPHVSSANTHGSPVSGSSGLVDDDYLLMDELRELQLSLPEPDPDMMDCIFNGGILDEDLLTVISRMDVKEVLMWCARAVSDQDLFTASKLMEVLGGQMVSVSGTPIERLAAYMLEGLRARLEYSGYTIYRKLRCDQPTGKELLSYMHVLSTICPYYNFAYLSSNIVIQEAMVNEGRIHIIDFQIAMGSQWVSLIESLARRPGGAPFIRVTGVDDENSAYARGGGLEIVAERLAKVAESYGVPFEFHTAAMSGCQVNRDNLGVRPGDAVAVNFPYVLHHMPDESVSTVNHRDRLLRLVKSLGPKVVTLVEQESNTNTAPFLLRFRETLDYYTAMFESIDVARPRNDRQRINAEQHCLARDIVNMIACEDAERVERHELHDKWKARLMMAGFSPYPVSSTVTNAVWSMLRKYHENYKISEWDGALNLGWKTRPLATLSAWR